MVGGEHRGWGIDDHPVWRVYVFAHDRTFPCVKSPLTEHGSNVKGFIVTKSVSSNPRIFSSTKSSPETQHQVHLLSSAESIIAVWWHFY